MQVSERREQQRLIGCLLKELERQVIAPGNLIRLRLYLHYHIQDINFVWFKLASVIDTSVAFGRVRRFHDERSWLYLSSTPISQVENVYNVKSPIRRQWEQTAHMSGHWWEDIIRDAFQQNGYHVEPKEVRIPLQGDPDVDSVEIDVFVCKPLPLGITVKNKLSDVYYDPSLIQIKSDDHIDIDRHFNACQQNQIIPILIAPQIDNSFYHYQKSYQGLFFRTLFQFLPSDSAPLCVEIRNHFRFAHVTAISAPPPRLLDWIKQIPRFLQLSQSKSQ